MIRSYSQNNKADFSRQLHPERLLFFVKGISKTWLIKQSIAAITIIAAIALKQSGTSETYFNTIGCLLLAAALIMIIRPELSKRSSDLSYIIVKSAGIWTALWFFGQNMLADIFACGTFLFFNTIGLIIRKQNTTSISDRDVFLSYLISGIISNISTFIFLLTLSQIHIT